jgi:hypothetical protein
VTIRLKNARTRCAGLDNRNLRIVRARSLSMLADQFPLRQSEQHHAAVGTDTAAVKSSADLLCTNCWKRKGQSRIVVHGGRGVGVDQHRIGFGSRILCSFSQLRLHARQPHQIAVMNKTG